MSSLGVDAVLPAGSRLFHDAGCLRVSADRPLRCISNALVGGGLGRVQHFCNFHVDKSYMGADPAGDLRDWLRRAGVDAEESLAMMTAVQLEHHAVHCEAGVLAVVTAGTGNAVDITAPMTTDTRLVGTINTIVIVDAALTDAGLVNACLSATEARVRALQVRGVRDPQTGTPASGTSTDCLAIAVTDNGLPSDYAGSATRVGRRLGHAVFRATCLALDATQAWAAAEAAR